MNRRVRPSPRPYTFTGADLNHLRLVVGWFRCEMGQTPEEHKAMLARIEQKVPGAITEASEVGKARMVESQLRAESFPEYVWKGMARIEAIIREADAAGTTVETTGRVVRAIESPQPVGHPAAVCLGSSLVPAEPPPSFSCDEADFQARPDGVWYWRLHGGQRATDRPLWLCGPLAVVGRHAMRGTRVRWWGGSISHEADFTARTLATNKISIVRQLLAGGLNVSMEPHTRRILAAYIRNAPTPFPEAEASP